ncbi:hypothetical protein ABZW18_28940 [Streptomyces sp. NPDC004647]|uniref:hypothetical protein n=1 Tax=Streptomyces sp. NPDC004647 TaxID=3154671 RepID=UPI00339EF1C2
MSRAIRTNKRRVLGIGMASAALITGVVATGAAMAGEDKGSSAAAEGASQANKCPSVNAKTSEAVTKAKEGVSFDASQLDAQLAKFLPLAGLEADSLQGLDDALKALPASDAGVLIDGIKVGGGGKAPEVKIKSLDQQKPKAYAKANPTADLGQMNAQLAALNQSLAEAWSESGGLENLQAAFGQIAVNSVIDVGDIELELKKDSAEQVNVKVKSLAGCDTGAAVQQ